MLSNPPHIVVLVDASAAILVPIASRTLEDPTLVATVPILCTCPNNYHAIWESIIMCCELAFLTADFADSEGALPWDLACGVVHRLAKAVRVHNRVMATLVSAARSGATALAAACAACS